MTATEYMKWLAGEIESEPSRLTAIRRLRAEGKLEKANA